MQRGTLIVLSAPSGTGKSSLVARLTRELPNLVFSVSATTRAPRAGERDGVHYHFLDEAAFRQRMERREFLEHAEVHGNLYGTLRDVTDRELESGHDVLLEIDVQGARQVAASHPDARLVFILPPSREELEARLRHRGLDAPEVIERRLVAARSEIACVGSFEFTVVNDDFDDALRRLTAIVTALRSTLRATSPRVAGVMKSFGLDPNEACPDDAR